MSAKWNAGDIENLKRWDTQGMDKPEIAERLGRSIKSVVVKLIRLKMSPEALSAMRAREKKRSHKRRKPDLGTHHICEPRLRIPPEALEEKNARLLAPRDLTGLICGDPPRGFSALDRRTTA